MANINDYLLWRGDVPFHGIPFNDVDNLILCEFAYLMLEHALAEDGEITVRELQGALYDKPEAFFYIERESNRTMLRLMAEGERFADARVLMYRHETDLEKEKQFAAVTIMLPDGTAFVSFRGTDNTLVGWKEDFNLSFTCPVPAQISAVEYLSAVAQKHPLPLRVGGHSKGGNLAVYAAACVAPAIQERIINVYSNDGPGMDETTFQSEGYGRIAPKLRSIVPQSSVIGILLQHPEDYMVVKSNAFGIFQHSPFSWQVLRAGFEIIENLQPGSRHLDEVMKTWLKGMSTEERMTVVDTMFSVLNATKAATVENLGEGILRNASAMMGAIKNLDIATRRQVRHIMGTFFSVALKRRDIKGQEAKALPADIPQEKLEG